MNARKVAVVVLNWNRPKDTLECLDALLPDVKRGLASIICCDNGSTDDSLQAIITWARQFFTEIQPKEISVAPFSNLSTIPVVSSAFILLETGANRGYAGGNNVGIRYAMEWGSFEYLWILNNDTVVEPCALTRLLAMAEDSPDIGALGSTIVDYHAPEQVQYAGGCRYFPLFTIMKPLHGGKDLNQVRQDRSEIRLDYIAGAALFIRTAAIEDIGLLNEDYFLYYEEADLAKRLKSKGYQLDWCRESVVRHKGGTTTGGHSQNNPAGTWTSNYHENLSTLKFTAEHYPRLLPFAALFRLLMKVVTTIVFRRWKAFLPFMMAYRDFFWGQRQSSRKKSAALKPQVQFIGITSDIATVIPAQDLPSIKTC